MPYIYALTDPRTQEVRYVGKANRPEVRLANHCCPRNLKKPTHRNSWIKQLRALGLRPGLLILEEVAPDAWAVAEQRWIAHYRAAGARLTNMTDGGEGADNPSPESRAKMARANRGRIPWNKGQKFPGMHGPSPVKTRTKQSDIAKAQGRRPSPLCIARSVEVHSGRPSWNKGLPMRESSKALLRSAWVVRSPSGQMHEVGDLVKFAASQGLSAKSLRGVAYGKARHHLGWICWKQGDAPQPEVVPEVVLAERESGKALRKTWVLTNPAGKEWVVDDLVKFSAEQGLRANCLRAVAAGSFRHHLGWTCRKA